MAYEASCPYDARMKSLVSSRPLIGARGYGHRSWEGTFYPHDLPREWRFIFYSHRCDAVLVPLSRQGLDPGRVALWEEEAPPDFQVVLEVPESALASLAAASFTFPSLIKGALVRLTRRTSAHEESLRALSSILPVSVDMRQISASLAQDLAHMGIGVCGRPAAGRPAQGPFAVSLLGSWDRPLLGRALSALREARAPKGSALFFTSPERAITGMEEAAMIAGLMEGSLKKEA